MPEEKTVDSERVVCTPSDFAKNSLVYLQEAGWLKALKRHVSLRSHLDSWLFLIVKKGSGTLVYQGERYFLQAGDCAFLDCRKEYSHETDDSLWELGWAHFNGNTVKDILRFFPIQPVFHPVQPDLFLLMRMPPRLRSQTGKIEHGFR